MLTLLKKLRQDENGVVLSAELAVVGTTMVMGVITGMTCLQSTVNDELEDLSGAFRGLNQSYSVPSFRSIGRSGCHVLSYTAGSSFRDNTALAQAAGKPDQANADSTDVREPQIRLEPVPETPSFEQGPAPDAPHPAPQNPQPIAEQRGVPLHGNPPVADHHPHAVPHHPAPHHPAPHHPAPLHPAPLHPAPADGGQRNVLVPHGRDHFRVDNGTPLHPEYGGSSSGNGGYYGGNGYYRRSISGPGVEVSTGVQGVRVLEYPSPATGLTLTEEQHLGYQTGRVPGAADNCAPIYKKPYLNIPNHVW